jgi:hypothetical protein
VRAGLAAIDGDECSTNAGAWIDLQHLLFQKSLLDFNAAIVLT